MQSGHKTQWQSCVNVSGLWEFQRLDFESRGQGECGGTFRKRGPTMDNIAALQYVEDFLHNGYGIIF